MNNIKSVATKFNDIVNHYINQKIDRNSHENFLYIYI